MNERFDLTGKTALITGSSGGLGLTIAAGLGEAGARVVLNGRNREKLDKAVASLKARGLFARGCAFDVGDAEGVRAGMRELEECEGGTDILVNNAGITRRGSLLELPEDAWNEVLNTNLSGAFLVGREVARGMVERGSGKIINICSLMSELARPSTAAYAAAKGGLKMLTRAMCAEWAGRGIQVNGIGPGYFVTELTQPLADDPEFDAWIKSRTPAGRWGKPEDLIGAAVFLASSASDFVNGQILYVDGGLSASI